MKEQDPFIHPINYPVLKSVTFAHYSIIRPSGDNHGQKPKKDCSDHLSLGRRTLDWKKSTAPS